MGIDLKFIHGFIALDISAFRYISILVDSMAAQEKNIVAGTLKH
jgi:hypothetical protein